MIIINTIVAVFWLLFAIGVIGATVFVVYMLAGSIINHDGKEFTILCIVLSIVLGSISTIVIAATINFCVWLF